MHARSTGIIILGVLIGSASLAVGQSPGAIAAQPISLSQTASEEPATQPVTREQVEQPAEEEAGLPISLGVSYYLLSDYVFRGINFSEYAGEGREQPNHQMTTFLSWDTGTWGTLGFDTFFEWYADQEKLNPYGGGQNLQEVDYTIRWTYGVEPIDTDVTLGYTFYTFPNLGRLLRTDKLRGNNNDDRTSEWWFRLNHNDAWAWKWLFPNNEDGVLNPYFLLAQDVGIGAGAVWMETGINHPFTIPGIDNLTITPAYTITADGGYLARLKGRSHNDYLGLAYDQLALNTTYDLTPVLHLPKWAGTVSISGLLYFNNALGNAEDDGTINDEFFGGMSVNWAWGG